MTMSKVALVRDDSYKINAFFVEDNGWHRSFYRGKSGEILVEDAVLQNYTLGNPARKLTKDDLSAIFEGRTQRLLVYFNQG